MRADDMIMAMGGVSEHLIDESQAGSRQMRDRIVSRMTTWAACIGLAVTMGVFAVIMSVIYGGGNVTPPTPANTGADIEPDGKDELFYMQDGEVLRLSDLSDEKILTALGEMGEVFEDYYINRYFNDSDRNTCDSLNVLRRTAAGVEKGVFDEQGGDAFDVWTVFSAVQTYDMHVLVKLYYLTFYDVYFDTSKLSDAELSALRERIANELESYKELCSPFYLQDGEVLRMSELSDSAIMMALCELDHEIMSYLGEKYFFGAVGSSGKYYDIVRSYAGAEEVLMFDEGCSVFDLSGGIYTSNLLGSDMGLFAKAYYLTFYNIYFDTSELDDAGRAELQTMIDEELLRLKERCIGFDSGSDDIQFDENMYHQFIAGYIAAREKLDAYIEEIKPKLKEQRISPDTGDGDEKM